MLSDLWGSVIQHLHCLHKNNFTISLCISLVCACVPICTCMCGLRPNWAVGSGQSGERVSRRGRGIATLHQFCFSGARSPEVALQHGCWVSVISLLEGGWHTVRWQCAVKIRQGGKAICFACNSDKCPMECCYYTLWGWGKFLYSDSHLQEQYSNTVTEQKHNIHGTTKSNKQYVIISKTGQAV